MKVKLDDLWLCQDCMIVAVNGDYSGFSYQYGNDERAIDKAIATVNAGLEALGPHLVSDFSEEEGEEEFSRRTCDCCQTHLAGARYRFAVLEESTPEDDTQTAIETAAARAFFACAWIDNEEENGHTYPGQDVYDVMPEETDPAAIHAARTLAMDWERTKGESMADTFAKVRDLAQYPAEPLTEEEFGYCAAMSAMGQGVGFFDRSIDLDSPYVEFGSYSLERDY